MRAVAALLPVLLTAWVYHPVTRTYFFADDFVCFLSILNDGFLRFVLRPFGGHNLLVRNLAFYGSYQLFGMQPEPYFWIVLLTHLLNVWLLFRVLENVTGSLALSCFGAALWGTSPAQVGTLGWYSVYGQVLVVTILLVLLGAVTARARTGTPIAPGAAVGWYALLLVGTTCFGTGVGIALVFPAVLFLVLPSAWRHSGIRLAYLTLPLVTVVLYFAFRRFYPILEPLTLNEAVSGNFSLARLRGALPMLLPLLAVSVDTTLRGTFLSTAHWPTGGTPIVLAAFGAGLAFLLWRGDATTRRVTAAMLVLAAGIYTVIAIGRAPFGRADIPLTWLAAQLRYHYVGMIPTVVVVCLVLRELGRLEPLRALSGMALLVAAFVLGGVGYVRSDFRIDDRANVRSYLAEVERGIAAEVDGQAAGTTVYLENGNASPVLLGPVMARFKPLFPGRAAIFLLAHAGDELDGHHVRFIERDPAVLARIERWPEDPLATLLVRPDGLPR